MLRASELRNYDRERRAIKKETFKQILETFMRKIKTASDLGDKFVFLTVPPIVFGYPLYTLDEARMYVGRQLTLLGYMVRHVSEAELCVTWGIPPAKKPVAAPRVRKRAPAPSPDDELTDFSSLMNLKKTAEKYKKKNAT